MIRVSLVQALFLALALTWTEAAPARAQFVAADGTPVVVGVQRGFRNKSDLCLDYGATRFRNGSPYRVIEPARTITSHEGMDFCRKAGSPVIAPVDGRIRFVEPDNPSWGGVVGITTGFSIRPAPGKSSQTVFVEMVHIVPQAGLKIGQRVKAGQLVGHVQNANRPSIGTTPHVHFAVRRCNDWPTCHIDPNFFWRDGPGRISCHNPATPLPKGRIVSPLPC